MKFNVEIIDRKRKQLGWNWRTLANRLETTELKLWRWRNGTATPDALDLLKLCDVLKISVTEFYE